MKNILCFGDSNTWGFDAAGTIAAGFPVRHPAHIRWTGVLARLLGPDYRIIEEAQNGRMTVHEDPMSLASRNARSYLLPCLESHKPLDLVVLMLGTNDLKTFLNLPPQDIAAGVAILGRMILQSESGPQNKAPRLLIVAPPALGDFAQHADLGERFAEGRAKSLRLPPFYAAVASSLGAEFFDPQGLISATPLDDIHLDAADHQILGEALATKLASLFANS
jgi:lysophospholipase L1-like esterase